MDNLEELIERVKNKEEGAFDELYNITYKKAYVEAMSFMKSEDKTEDALQLAYIKVSQSIDQLDDPAKLYSWINTIVARTCLNELNKRKQYSFSDYESDDYSIDVEDEDRDYRPEENYDYESDREVVMGFIDDLPDAQRTALTMQIYDGMKISEIADVFEVSENTIKSRINYAKKTIKEKVTEYKKLGNTLFSMPLVPYLQGIFAEYEKTIVINTSLLEEIGASTTALTTGAKQVRKVANSLRNRIVIGATSATVVVAGAGYYMYNLKTDVDLTANLEYSIVGVDNAGTIEVTGNSFDDISENIDSDKLITGYQYSSNKTLSNGDTITITVEYDEDYADEQKLNIENNETEVVILGLKSRYKNKDDISQETMKLIHDYALDILFKEARYNSGSYYIYKDESDYKRNFSLNEETFEIVKTYLVKFTDSSIIKTDQYFILMRSSYEYQNSQKREIRCRYRYLVINDFYKDSINSTEDVETLSSDLMVFNPQDRFPETKAIDTFESGFSSDYSVEEVKYYFNEGMDKELKTYYPTMW